MTLQQQFPKFRVPEFMPTLWINKFEVVVGKFAEQRNCGLEIETLFFNLLPFFLHESDSQWFFSQRSLSKKSWSHFKMDFASYFSNKYWTLMRETLSSSYNKDEGKLCAFVCSKVDNLKSLFPELTQSSIIKICCASVPDEYSCELEESIDQGLTMFKQRVMAIEKRDERKSTTAHEQDESVASGVHVQAAAIDNMVSKSMENFFVSDDFKKLLTNILMPKSNTQQE